MSKKRVIFFGKKRDKYGSLTPFHHYRVIALPDKVHNKYHVLINIGGSEGAQQTPVVHHIQAKSEQDAIEKAISELKNHPDNKDLEMEVVDIP